MIPTLECFSIEFGKIVCLVILKTPLKLGFIILSQRRLELV